MTKKLKYLALAVALCGGLFTFPGCGTLDPTGVYQGDKFLYDADTTISTAYEAVHSFVSWEYQNRSALKTLPQIKEYADTLRTNYPIWHRAAIGARNVYTSAKTSANKDAFSLTLNVLRNAMTQSQQFMASNPSVSPLAQ